MRAATLVRTLALTSALASCGGGGSELEPYSRSSNASSADALVRATVSVPSSQATAKEDTQTPKAFPAVEFYRVETFAGTGSPSLGDGGPATLATLVDPDQVLASPSGVVYISDTSNNRVAAVNAAGVISTFAGRISAEYQPLGDGGLATDAIVRFPRGLYETADGLYLGDHSYTVRLVAPNGVISNAAITDRAAFILPWGIAVDSLKRIFIADISHHRVLRADPGGAITIVAGTGVVGTSGDGGPGPQAQLSAPRSVHLDVQGNLLIGSSTVALRKLDLTSGTITTRLPNVMPYFDVDNSGFFITGRGQQVLRIHPDTGVETVIAGTGVAGFSGDGGPAMSAQFNRISGISIDAAGNIFVVDTGNHRVRKIAPGGLITTLAGGGPTPKQLTGIPDSQGIAFDPTGNMFITDFQYHFLRRILPTGASQVVAGIGAGGTSGDGGPARDASFSNPSVMAFDKFGRLMFLDLTYGTGAVRMIEPGADGIVDGDADETITTIAGRNVDRSLVDNGAADGGPARNAVFNAARDFAIDSKGNLIIPDWQAHRVRKVTPGADQKFNGGVDEIITTIAGVGTAGQNGDGGLATSASVGDPTRIALDSRDNIYLFVGTNTGQRAIRRIDATTGIITTVTQNLEVFDLLMDRANRLYYVSGPQVWRVDTRTGAQILIAGTGQVGYGGDGGDALEAKFRGIGYLAVDSHDNLYVADNGNFRIRRLMTKHDQLQVVRSPPTPAH